MLKQFQTLRDIGFDIELYHYAAAIIAVDFPEALEELCPILAD